MSSAYTVAIDATADTIVQRALQYKWLVIMLSVLAVTVMLAVGVGRLWLPLGLFALLPFLVLGYSAMDLRLVHRWRHAVLEAWVAGELQLDLFAQTLSKVPTLPGPTVAGMLDCLPAWDGSQVSLPARPALVRAQQRIAVSAEAALWWRTACWACAAAAVLATWITGSATWLGVGLVLPVAGWAISLGRRRRMRRHFASLLREWQSAGVSVAGSRPALQSMNWQGVSPADFAAWHQTVSTATALD
jgi:hypothetical protein